MPKQNAKKMPELSEDAQELHKQLDGQSALGVIVLATAFIDAQLLALLGARLRPGKTSESLLDSRSGALGSFAARADLCYSLGMISKSLYQDLRKIGEVRNEIAHNHLQVSFTDRRILQACRELIYLRDVVKLDVEPLFNPLLGTGGYPVFRLTVLMIITELQGIENVTSYAEGQT